MTKLTDAQFRLLTVIADAGSSGLRPGEAAFRAGYKGKGRSGAGRAPQWTGRVAMNMPAGLMTYRGRGWSITPLGLHVLAGHGREGA
jgi:hypothetical protein